MARVIHVMRWTAGTVAELGREFRILEFPPRPGREDTWSYVTVGMSQGPEAGCAYGLELHLLAPSQAEAHVGLLTMAACFHIRAEALGWGHKIEFGMPWYPGACLGYGLISIREAGGRCPHSGNLALTGSIPLAGGGERLTKR